ncbi:ATP synthase F0 sector subunit b [hydrothermal vent metagenome]|uniref:ATP synthase F0 sector subunit b n=1 Tax=hydrothermal vent metagenome TaxID=652676 RepID=A0A3B1E9D3_9ZZZZ
MNKILLLVCLSSILFGADIMETDFIPRVVNFLIFVGIAYYLIANQIKDMLNKRKEDIQQQLAQAQEKLANSKKQKIQASIKIQESEKLSLDIIKTAKDECKNIDKRYKKQTEQALLSIKKGYEDKMKLDTRRAKVEVTKEVLNDFINDSFNSISQEEIVNIINKKVA